MSRQNRKTGRTMQIDDIRRIQQMSGSVGAPGVIISGEERNQAVSMENTALRDISISDPVYGKNSLAADNLMNISEEQLYGQSEISMKNQMIATAESMTEEDYAAMEEEGYNPKDMEPVELVNIVDKIKAALAKGGMDITAMGGISDAAVDAMSGDNNWEKKALEKALGDADLPVTEDILNDGVAAMRKGAELSDLTDASLSYLVKNGLEPTIENVYTANFSQVGKYASIREVTPEIQEAAAGMESQIREIYEKAGVEFTDLSQAEKMLADEIPMTPENVAYYNRLAEGEVSSDAKDILKNILIGVSEGKMPTDSYAMEGFSMRERAEDAVNVLASATEETVSAMEQEGEPLTIANLKARAAASAEQTAAGQTSSNQSLEALASQIAVSEGETSATFSSLSAYGSLVSVTGSYTEITYSVQFTTAQLCMTSQANYALISSGIPIETTPLAELLDNLREIESKFYEDILGTSNPEMVGNYENTLRLVQQADGYPLASLAAYSSYSSITTVSYTEFHTTAMSYATRYEEASQRYETMGTQVRKDLGDSISKAFGNVDDILEDLEMDVTEENRRATRILGYNSLEITRESVEEMSKVDAFATSTIKSLKPAVIAEMVKQGMNPLDMSMQELKDTATEIQNEIGDDSEESYAKFLWKMEQTGELTSEERESYMGVCRLIYQVEQTDGAVIGALLHQGAEPTLRNMMTAIRSDKKEGSMDYTVDDDFGEISSNVSLSITEQIETAFQTSRMQAAGEIISPAAMSSFGSQDTYMNMTPDQFAGSLEQYVAEHADSEEALEEQYVALQQQEMKEALQSEEQVYQVLRNFDLPGTVTNLSAIQSMLTNRNEVMRKLLAKTSNDREEFSDTVDEDATLSDMIDEVWEAFGEAVKTPEDMAEAERKLAELAEHAMDNVLVDSETGYVDVRGMKQIVTQTQAMMDMGQKSETYAIPILVADEFGNMSLKIVRGKEEKGQVDISFLTEKTGTVYASFSYEEGSITGTVSTDRTETREIMEKYQSLLSEKMSEAADASVSIKMEWTGKVDANDIFTNTDYDFEVTEERTEISTTRLYGMARSFIETLGEISFA